MVNIGHRALCHRGIIQSKKRYTRFMDAPYYIFYYSYNTIYICGPNQLVVCHPFFASQQQQHLCSPYLLQFFIVSQNLQYTYNKQQFEFSIAPIQFQDLSKQKNQRFGNVFFSTNLHITVKRLKKQKSSLQKIDFGSPFLHLESKTVGSGSDKNRSLFKTFYTNPPTV